MKPYFSHWVARGPAVEAAARKSLATHFSSIAMCQGNMAADVLAVIVPKIHYNPVPGRYKTKVTVVFLSGDGKPLGNLVASGQFDAPINSVYIEDDISRAFEDAMSGIAVQFASNSHLQQGVQQLMQGDMTRMPCEMATVLPAQHAP